MRQVGWQNSGASPSLAFPVLDPDTNFTLPDPDINPNFSTLAARASTADPPPPEGTEASAPIPMKPPPTTPPIITWKTTERLLSLPPLSAFRSIQLQPISPSSPIAIKNTREAADDDDDNEHNCQGQGGEVVKR
ncbi:hypothetical protein WN944_014078 [Citrus x changshan-huyou]|uniref:Uncharacterized protein n=1 Tax=Citrus x changshan-huyou TaxID=2935761 RepID=A0AAP0QPQ4_9ROSI